MISTSCSECNHRSREQQKSALTVADSGFCRLGRGTVFSATGADCESGRARLGGELGSETSTIEVEDVSEATWSSASNGLLSSSYASMVLVLGRGVDSFAVRDYSCAARNVSYFAFATNLDEISSDRFHEIVTLESIVIVAEYPD